MSNKVLFCNIAYTKFYDSYSVKEIPQNGGSYVAENRHGHEINNFHVHEDGKVRGFVETKSRKGATNQLHIEKIDPAFKLKDRAYTIDVVFCAYSNKAKHTVVVGWYKNATVLRGREKYNDLEYNIIAESNDAFLVPEEDRTTFIPRAPTDGIGFGRSNIWYANTPESEEIVSKVRNLIYNKNTEAVGKKNMISEEIKIRLMSLYADLQQALAGKAEVVVKSSRNEALDPQPAVCVKGNDYETNVYIYPEAYRIETYFEWQDKSNYTGICDYNEFWFFVDTSDECIGEIKRIIEFKRGLSKTPEWKGPSELRKNVSAEKFELIFKDFLRQADDNAKTGKSFGGKTPKSLDNCFFDGAHLRCHYGQGAASKTPYLNWWVLSIYYLPNNGNIVMGIEDYRYPYIDQMKPIIHKFVGNKQDKVAVFYETTKSTLNYKDLYNHFVDVAEQIMKLGVVDYNTIKSNRKQ